MISLWKVVVYPTIVLIGALALFAYKNAKKIINKYRNVKQVEADSEWQSFIRTDFNKWDERQIIIGCFIRFPFKFLALFSYIIGLALLIIFSFTFKKIGQILQTYYVRYVGKILLLLAFDIKQENSIKDVETPVIISNHVCWMDVIYLVTKLYPLSIVAKEDISHAPLVGSIAKYLQCLFILRSSESARKDILQKIQQRVKNWENFQDVNPLLIFPEGTTSNGRSIMKFKIGAFASLPKITIYGLIYECKGFDMGMDEVTPLEHFILSLSLRPKLTVKSVEIEACEGQTPEDYMARCQIKMSQITGFRIYSAGYTEKCAFKEQRFGLKSE